jgi:hypothetical protein
VVVWTCYANEVGMLFWSMSGRKTVPSNAKSPGNANTYLGPEARQYFRVLQNFVRDMPVDTRPLTIINTNHNRDVRVSGVGNGDRFVVYVHHYTSHETVAHPEPLRLWTGKGRFAVTWIDPTTGDAVREYEAGTGHEIFSLSVPPVQIDAACKMRRMAEGEVFKPAAAAVESKALFGFEDGKPAFGVEDDVKDVVDLSVVTDPKRASAGARCLKMVLRPHDWPGMNTKELPADWSSYEALRFDVTAEQDMPLAVRIDDVNSKDYASRFNGPKSYLTKGRNTVTVWLSDAADAIDLRQVKGLYIFSMGVQQPLTLYVDNVRLEKRR